MNDSTTTAAPEPIKIGQLVATMKGASFWGRVIGLHDLDGDKPGAVVEAVAEGFEGTRHVYPLAQLTHYSPSGAGPLNDAARDVLAERRRQIEVEGRTPAWDDVHRQGELARAAATYALASAHWPEVWTVLDKPVRENWPWALRWWKPKDRRRDLVRAGALILAEIERLDRKAAAEHVNDAVGYMTAGLRFEANPSPIDDWAKEAVEGGAVQPDLTERAYQAARKVIEAMPVGTTLDRLNRAAIEAAVEVVTRHHQGAPTAWIVRPDGIEPRIFASEADARAEAKTWLRARVEPLYS